MQRPRAATVAGALAYFGAFWFLLGGILILLGISGPGSAGEVVDWQVRLGRSFGSWIIAGTWFVAGHGLFAIKCWARILCLFLAFWSLGGAIVGLSLGGVMTIVNLLLVAAPVGIIWLLFTRRVRESYVPPRARPWGVVVLSVLYFLQGAFLVLPVTILLSFSERIGVFVGVCVGLAALYAFFVWVGISLCDLRRWARTWVLVTSTVTLVFFVIGLLVVLNLEGDVGGFLGRSLLSVSISVWALWYLQQTRLREAFLVQDSS